MDWQPIKTAPTDGTEVIVFAPGEMHRYEAGGVFTAMCVGGEWYASSGGEMMDRGGEYIELVNAYPSHWMPLPEPPK